MFVLIEEDVIGMYVGEEERWKNLLNLWIKDNINCLILAKM